MEGTEIQNYVNTFFFTTNTNKAPAMRNAKGGEYQGNILSRGSTYNVKILVTVKRFQYASGQF